MPSPSGPCGRTKWQYQVFLLCVIESYKGDIILYTLSIFYWCFQDAIFDANRISHEFHPKQGSRAPLPPFFSQVYVYSQTGVITTIFRIITAFSPNQGGYPYILFHAYSILSSTCCSLMRFFCCC